MKKSDRKTDNNLRAALTDACETALDNVEGFRWLTHLADYKRFPASLKIICVFDTDRQLAAATTGRQDDFLRSVIREKLRAAGFDIAGLEQRIYLDTEEACAREHGGRWQDRL